MLTIIQIIIRHTDPMKILSWNVAGIRATIKKDSLLFLNSGYYDVVCFQETKATAEQVKMPEDLDAMYPFRYWRSTLGTTQRKGLSGTAIWSKNEPIAELEPPEIDEEGRVTAIEFEKIIVVTVYTPNSQAPGTDRHLFRSGVWDDHFREYICDLNARKPTIVCGDLNVVHQDIDIHNPDRNRNKVAGFLDDERINFQQHLKAGFVDAFRVINSEPHNYTYWDQRMPHLRKTNRGWRIDYFLVPVSMKKKIKNCRILKDQLGSDHCPIDLEISNPRKLKIV